GGRFRDAADDDAPRPAGQVVEHDDRERAERDREAEEPAHEPRPEERGGAEGGAAGGNDECGGADGERSPLEANESGVRHDGGSAVRRPRSSGGTSSRRACWLRWRARM